ncbi:MAG TPA: ACT domain-containing protein [Candidatus Elarobacter sp.]
MPGETDLRALLAGMTPTLRPETYVIWTLPPGEPLPPGIAPFATVREDEGLTVVIERERAQGSRGDEEFRAITLCVYSNLNAVGFIACVTHALAQTGVPANVIAGFYHDHILVPAAHAGRAMTVLHELARGRTGFST